MRHPTSALAFWLGAPILAVLTACAGSSDDVADEASSRTTIGAAGGVAVSADGGLRLTVPPGALSADTSIAISAVAPADVPANLVALNPQRVYRLEPAGTRFAVPVEVVVTLPASADGALAAWLIESAGAFELPAGLSFRGSPAGRTISGSIGHFSNIVVDEFLGFTAVLTVSATEVEVGKPFTAQGSVRKSTSGLSGTFGGAAMDASPPAIRTDLDVDPDASNPKFVPDVASLYRLNFRGICESAGTSSVTFSGEFVNAVDFFAPFDAQLRAALTPIAFDVKVSLDVECKAGIPPTEPVVSVGLFNIPGLTAPDGINYFAGPVASLATPGPFIAAAGAEGVKVVDAVTKQVVLDRTVAGPDGATLGTNLLGVVPVAQAASAGAPAALIGFNSAGASVQNWNATTGWGASIRDAVPTFDAVTPGGALAASTVVLVRPIHGIDVVSFDATAAAYRTNPARSAPYSAFPGIGNLVSAHMPDPASGGLLVLARAAGSSISTSSKVFYKNLDSAQPATTLTSWGNADTRRLRCIPVGTKQACVATLFGGEGRAFLFDPATPTATPAVIVLTAAAGTLGVALTALPNGHVGVVMANFSANSLTVAELSSDMATIHSLNTIPAPAGCTGTAHPALLTDSEGLKAMVSCNGTSNFWVVKPFA